jgi:ankyrin repeat protein
MLQHLESLGTNLHEVDSQGLTALHYACENNSFDACAYLMQHNLSPFRHSKLGLSPFDHCMTNRLREKLQKLYYEQGFNPHVEPLWFSNNMHVLFAIICIILAIFCENPDKVASYKTSSRPKYEEIE